MGGASQEAPPFSSYPSQEAQNVKRIVKLKCIKDPHIVEFFDAGVDREGNPTGQRQALTRALGKRTTALVDGKEMVLPTFLVVEVGEWSLYPGEKIPADESFLEYDSDVVKREHPDHMLAKWNKAQEKFIAKSVESRRQAERMVEDQQAADLARTMRDMVKAHAQANSGKKVANG